jgi:hypothetical protein
MAQDGKKPQNIFEAASQLEKKRHEKEAKKEAPPAPAAAPQPVQNPQLAEIFQRCKQLHNEITKSLDQAFKQGGITPTQLRTYVSRPQNFSQADWQSLEQQKKKTESMIQELKDKVEKGATGELPKPEQIRPETKEELPPSTRSPPPPETPPAKPPAKKPKIITKRQWIGM